MANISITAGSVLPGTNAKIRQGVAGATITAGQPLYYDSASSSLKLADANVSATLATVVGIALQGASSGQRVEYVYDDDDFTPGATLSLATPDFGVYVLSATAGAIAPHSDLAAAMYPVVLFVAKSSTKAILKIINGTGVAV